MCRLFIPPAVTHNACVKLEGERASADHEAAKAFPSGLVSLVEEKGYQLEQLFNADETVFLWKKMPTRTFISQQESKAAGFKAAKDQVSLFLCANAEGDFVEKPMMLYHSLNPCALKNKNKQVLLV